MSNDLINRKALLDEIDRRKKKDPFKKMRGPVERWIRRFGYDILWSIVKHVPAVDAVPVKHGHWILKAESWQMSDGGYDEEMYVECSECGRRIWDIDPYGVCALDRYPYCNCGVKMDRVQREGDT